MACAFATPVVSLLSNDAPRFLPLAVLLHMLIVPGSRCSQRRPRESPPGCRQRAQPRSDLPPSGLRPRPGRKTEGVRGLVQVQEVSGTCTDRILGLPVPH